MSPERWQRMNEVFHAALACEAHDRAAYLAEACAGDPDLLAEVESLLNAHAVPKNFIDAPIYEAAAELVAEAPTRSLVGTQFGAYRVLDQLGAGGMSVVYLAEDTRLGRQVALKLLPAEFISDPDRLSRFGREARATSALNHPNIITIYEIGEVEGVHFIATEFVAGQTLRQRMAEGRMELRDVLEVTAQGASALVAAHSAGVVHRDIKPENVMLRSDGLVKVLDFGLAKLAGHRAPAGRTKTPAQESVRTSPGVVMGTFNYMSPEQARGQDVDARSDLFSLGVVMHELVSGQAPFVGETPSDVIAAVLTVEPPPLQHYRPEVPAELQWIVAKSLRKDREERYQSSKELFGDLKRLKQEWEFQAKLQDSFPRETRLHGGVKGSNGEAAVVGSEGLAASRGGAGAAPQPSVAAPLATTSARPKRGMAMALAALLLAVAASVIWLYQFRRPRGTEILAAPMRVVPFTALPGREEFPAFSPDGNQLAFTWEGTWDGGQGGNVDIYVKLIGVGAPLRLTTDPAEDSFPAWSPDGRYIAFVRHTSSEDGVFMVPALGGSERQLLKATGEVFGLSWSSDGKSLALTDGDPAHTQQSIFRLSVEEGEKRRLAGPALSFSSPVFSPDGKWLAFVRYSNPNVGDLCLMPAAGGEVRQLTFDNGRIARLAWGPDGREIIFSSDRVGGMSLWRMPVSGGRPERVAVAGNNAWYPAISQQGNRLAFNESLVDSDIYRIEVSGAPRYPAAARRLPPTKLIFSTREDHSPQISPDSRQIAFVSTRTGSEEIWVCASDGAGPRQLTSIGGPSTGSPRWSPDGRSIAFDSRLAGNLDLYVISAEGGKPRQLTTDLTYEILPSWSHDGHWLYFCSNRDGSRQIWKMPVAGGQAVRVTTQGGFESFESPDGKLLYYTKGRGPGGIWRAPVEGGEEAQVPELAQASYWRYWAVVDSGIYFLSYEAPQPSAFKFFSFATHRVSPLGVLEKEPLVGPPGLTVSPDGRWLLYAQVDQRISDIMLIENFR